MPALERIAAGGQAWPLMAEKYGVGNPVPPWRSRLDATCEALDREASALPLRDRRNEEDLLSTAVYDSLPYPENQLVALAHSLLARGIIDEADLVERLRSVRARLEAL
ncbi:thiocyanate hydrolase [Rhodococcus sp. D2-41]|nr:thiocyanate hydrolase [Rhodococcus sp. D2-41]